MNWKSTARLCLHAMGGLAMVRRMRRRESRILMFHAFSAGDAPFLDAVCSHIASHFEPVTLSEIVNAAEEGRSLPDCALTVTVDDGYRNYLEYAHPIFRHHRIPTTIYPVADFADGHMWLWTDQVAYCVEQTSRRSIRASVGGREPLESGLSTSAERAHATEELWEALKLVPDGARLAFLEELGPLTGVDIPAQPPARYRSLDWEELRDLAADRVEIGCHTRTHPILSRVPPGQLEHEIRGAKELMEERLGFPVAHFCYPNGRDIDIGADAMENVRRAGFRSAVTTTWGLNTPETDPILMRRVPLGTDLKLDYVFELLAGLHMPRHFPEEKAKLAA